jgi:hypothetical protein
MSDQYIIYGLIDPRTLLIHYIGKSAKGLRRPKQHRTDATRTDQPSSRPVCLWIRDLLSAGLTYEVVILESQSPEGLGGAERWWIAYGQALGWPLTNMMHGGGGGLGLTRSLECRAKISAANRRRVVSEETKARISASCKVALSSPEVRARISAGTKAAFALPENRAKLLARGPMTEEHKAKIGNAIKARNARQRGL